MPRRLDRTLSNKKKGRVRLEEYAVEKATKPVHDGRAPCHNRPENRGDGLRIVQWRSTGHWLRIKGEL